MHPIVHPESMKVPSPIPNVRIEPIPELFARRCSGGRCFKDAKQFLIRDLDGHELRSPYCDDCVAVLARSYARETPSKAVS
ncbi:MAG: hypothetical protein ACJ8C4_00530 [Gemmataceae bacterium]